MTTSEGRPICPVCGIPVHLNGQESGRQKYRCPRCRAQGFGHTFARSALRRQRFNNATGAPSRRHVVDHDRPTCPRCGRPARRERMSDAGQRYRCAFCGVYGTADSHVWKDAPTESVPDVGYYDDPAPETDLVPDCDVCGERPGIYSGLCASCSAKLAHGRRSAAQMSDAEKRRRAHNARLALERHGYVLVRTVGTV